MPPPKKDRKMAQWLKHPPLVIQSLVSFICTKTCSGRSHVCNTQLYMISSCTKQAMCLNSNSKALTSTGQECNSWKEYITNYMNTTTSECNLQEAPRLSMWTLKHDVWFSWTSQQNAWAAWMIECTIPVITMSAEVQKWNERKMWWKRVDTRNSEFIIIKLYVYINVKMVYRVFEALILTQWQGLNDGLDSERCMSCPVQRTELRPRALLT